MQIRALRFPGKSRNGRLRRVESLSSGVPVLVCRAEELPSVGSNSDRLNDPLTRYPLSATRIVHRYTAASEALPCNVHNPGLRLIKRYAELFENLYRSGRGVLRLGPIPAGHYLVPPIACAGTRGFEFLGFKIQKNLYAIPTQKSVDRKDQIRTLTPALKARKQGHSPLCISRQTGRF